MDHAVKFIVLARDGLPMDSSASSPSALTLMTKLKLKSLYWIGANYYSHLNLPDLERGTWREAILRCLQCVYPQLMAMLSTRTVSLPSAKTMPLMKLLPCLPLPPPLPKPVSPSTQICWLFPVPRLLLYWFHPSSWICRGSFGRQLCL